MNPLFQALFGYFTCLSIQKYFLIIGLKINLLGITALIEFFFPVGMCDVYARTATSIVHF